MAAPQAAGFPALVAVVALAACAAQVTAPPAPGGRIGDRLGVQLYSVRASLEKDLPGTLASLRKMGFRQVEVHRTFDRPASEFRRLLEAAGLTARSMMAPFDRLRTELPAVIADARALGVTFVVCPWIPHEGDFDAADTARAIDVFTTAGRGLAAAGLRLLYHTHGYETFPGGIGETALDRMLAATKPGELDFEMDVFYIVHGGGDPVAFLDRYPGRFPLLHLKDMRAGTPTRQPTGKADPGNTVALGTGTINLARVIAAAERQGARYYFVEDESPAAPENLPVSLAWLSRAIR